MLPEGGDELARDRAGFAVADVPTVKVDGGDDLGGRAT